MRATQLILTATVALTMLAALSCKKKEEAEAAPEATASATITDTPAEPEAINPDWKTKCPDADRPLSGTVTALKNLTVRKAPQDGAETVGSIGPGTWVNLLGIKVNWYCIDFPCEVGKLCPGWVEERYTQRKTVTKDAGVVDAAVAAVPEAGVVDSGKQIVDIKPDAAAPTGAGGAGGSGPAPTATTTTTTIPGTKLPPGGRPPPIKKK